MKSIQTNTQTLETYMNYLMRVKRNAWDLPDQTYDISKKVSNGRNKNIDEVNDIASRKNLEWIGS